jgi:tRNA/rRNA methyltransferase
LLPFHDDLALELRFLPAPLKSDNLRVVLVETRNPLNIGAAARAMSNFGILQLGVVNPYDVAFRKAKSAVGAAALLENATEYKTVAEAVADCTLVVGTTAVRHRELQHPLRRLEYGARLIRKRMQSSRVALLFGSEKYGLSRRDLSHCHWLMRIPTRDEHISMNLGQAVAVCLYELVRDDRVAGVSESQALAASEDVERMTAILLDALSTSTHMTPDRAPATEERVRRMVRRLKISAHDAEAWLGVLRQILWELRHGKLPAS